jgi:hypothetical protein
VHEEKQDFSTVQVSVNGVEVRAVKPGVYRHTITGIAFEK